MSLRDLILKADDLKRVPVEVPEWETTVYVRTMTGLEQDRFEVFAKEEGGLNVRAALLVASVCDEDGQPVFVAEDIPALGEKSGAALDRLVEVAMRLSGIGKKDMDALEKNS